MYLISRGSDVGWLTVSRRGGRGQRESGGTCLFYLFMRKYGEKKTKTRDFCAGAIFGTLSLYVDYLCFILCGLRAVMYLVHAVVYPSRK